MKPLHFMRMNRSYFMKVLQFIRNGKRFMEPLWMLREIIDQLRHNVLGHEFRNITA